MHPNDYRPLLHYCINVVNVVFYFFFLGSGSKGLIKILIITLYTGFYIKSARTLKLNKTTCLSDIGTILFKRKLDDIIYGT